MTPRQRRLAGLSLALAGSLGACYPDGLVAPPEAEPRPWLAAGGGLVGRVTTADSHEPLVGANALLIAADGRVVQSVGTDQSGTFAFRPVAPGTYRVRVRAIGYLPDVSAPRVLDSWTATLPSVALRKDPTVMACNLVVVGVPNGPGKR